MSYDHTIQSTRRVTQTRPPASFTKAQTVDMPPPRSQNAPQTLPPQRQVPGLPFQLPERYSFIEELGRGGMGLVARVHDRELKRDVALKVILPDRASRDALTRFTTESRVTARLEHPAIMPVHDAGSAQGGFRWYTMKLVSGVDLKQRQLDEERGKSFPLEEKLNIVIRVAEGLSYMHSEGVIHRDMKPENILIGEHGEILIADLGIAKELDATADVDTASVMDESDLVANPAVTMQGKVMGTPAFMAPEQARGLIDRIGPWTDIWALGGVLYSMVTGTAPYISRKRDVMELLKKAKKGRVRPAEEIADVPPALAAIIAKALHPVPNRRYRNAQEMARDLRAFLADEPVSVYKPPTAERAARWVRRNPTKSMAGVLVVLFALIGGALGSYLVSQAAAHEREAELAAARADAQERETELATARAAAAEEREEAQRAAAREAELQRQVAEQQAERERLKALAEAEKFDELREAVGLEARRQRDAATAAIWEALRKEAGVLDDSNVEDTWWRLTPGRLLNYAHEMEQALQRQQAVGTTLSPQDLLFTVAAFQRVGQFSRAAAWIQPLLDAPPVPDIPRVVIDALVGAQKLNTGDLEGARQWFQESLRKQPQEPRLWAGLVEVYSAQENWPELLQAAMRYRQLPASPDRTTRRDVVILVLQGRAYRGQHDLDAAEALCREALELAPDMWEPYSELGMVAFEGNDLPAAQEWFEQGLTHCADPAQRAIMQANVDAIRNALKKVRRSGR